ncbi:chemotaxis protein CheW [Janthinobacterium sp. RB2R34]|uniref:chemotaxis protein CheW n=1 Tax=Janthinobacterium sp. RB2R34 TaxID=3424193 RepID=UPI003F2471F0
MAAPTDESRWVLLELGHLRIAVPLETVLQAYPRPADLTMVARRRGALCSMFACQGKLVPVVDLALWVEVGECAPGGAARSRIVVLQNGRRTLGLLVDAVHEVVTLAQADIVRLHHDNDPEEVFHSVARMAGDAQPVSLLDSARLMALAEIWAEEQDGPASTAAAEAGARHQDIHAGQQSWAVVESCGIRLALPATDVGEVVQARQVVSSSAAGAGFCHWRGRHIAVLDTSALFGGPKPAAPQPLMLIACSGELALALPVDRIVQVHQFPYGAGTRPVRLNAPQFVQAIVIDDDGTPVQVIDTAALVAAFPQSVLSRVDQSGDSSEPGAGLRNMGAYIVYIAGTVMACPIEALEQVLPAPAGAPAASMVWCNELIDLVDLRSEKTAAGHVIVVRNQGVLCGVMVDRIVALIPPNSAYLSKVRLPSGQFEMITTGYGSEQTSYRIFNIADAQLA